MTSTRKELANYLSNWQDPLLTSDLAKLLGLSVATVHIYKSRMDLDPISYKHLLPKHLPKRGKRVLYSKADVLDWWSELDAPKKHQRGRPTIESTLLKRKTLGEKNLSKNP